MASIFGRSVIVPLTNKSGGGVVLGDVVIIDTTTDESFTTTTSAANTSAIGVAAETIANNAIGRVVIGGYVSLVNVNASVTRNQFGTTHTVAKQAVASATRVAGTFCRWLKTSATPSAYIYPVDLAGAALSNPMSAIGDIIQGTTAGAPAALAAPLAGKVLTGAGVTTSLAYAYPPGYEFDYVEITASVTVTGTAEASETTVITGTSVAYDGSTKIMIDFYAPRVDFGGDNSALVVMLYDGATVLGRLCTPIAPDQSAASLASWGSVSISAHRRLTPTNASHQYIIKAWRTVANMTISVGAGGTGTDVAAFLRITKV